MKVINKITLGLVAATLLLVGCNESATPAKSEVVKPTISETSLGLRKTTLYNESVKPHGTSYSKEYAGTSQKIERAFQDAPPMIPHDTEGMLPVTINDNQCIMCHDPMVAESMGAIPYPPSHMTNFRPTSSYAIKGENTSSETLSHISIKKEDKLVGARFNCTQCHAPQDTGVLAVPNNFEADYSAVDGASKSTWDGSKLMEGLNTFESSK
jgi:cytochrome c-type protein NapB